MRTFLKLGVDGCYGEISEVFEMVDFSNKRKELCTSASVDCYSYPTQSSADHAALA